MLKVMLVLSILYVSDFAMARSAGECSRLMSEFKSMQEAQSALLQSMVHKDKIFAQTLNEYSTNLKVASAQKRVISKKDIQSLDDSSSSLKTAEKKDALIVQKFEQATDKLSQKIEVCLADKN